MLAPKAKKDDVSPDCEGTAFVDTIAGCEKDAPLFPAFDLSSNDTSGIKVDDLVARARALVRGGHRAILGIAGPPGAGKSTLGAALVEAIGPQARLVPMDGFHLAKAALAELGIGHRRGAPDTFDVGGYVRLLREIRADHATVFAPAFDRNVDDPVAGAIRIGPDARLIVTEGNYLLLESAPWDAVAEILDESWYIDAPADQRRDWLTARHVRNGQEPHDADAWVQNVDEPNAVLVGLSAHRATLHLRVA